MKPAGFGQVIFWNGGSLWIGQAGQSVALHAHHAIQICIGLDGPVEFRESPDDAWMSFRAAFVPPNLPHEFRASGYHVANFLFEPLTHAGKAVLARFGNGGFAAIPDADIAEATVTFSRLHADRASARALTEASLDFLARIAGGRPLPEPGDPRILRVIGWIAARLDQPIGLAEAAAVACLSEDRFRHLFVQETGITFRPYLLWARLNLALALGFSGTAWSEAALAAGFADQAHLIRTCRRMLGLVPTALRITPAVAA